MRSLFATLASLLVAALLLSVAFASSANAQVGDGREALVPDSFSRDSFDASAAPTRANAADSQFRAAAYESIRPTVTCYVKLDNKTRRTYFGYDSSYLSTLTLNVGFWNWATTSGNEGQPTTFAPGSYDAVFSIDHPKNETRYWFLGWYYASTKKAKKCKDSQVPVFPNPALAAGFFGVAGLVVMGRRHFIGSTS